MALVHADMVKETSTTTGTGTYDLAGAVAGFRTFVAGIATGNTCYYSASNGTDWEVGLGTVTDASPDTLARTTVLASSNAGAAVNWGAGVKTLVCTVAAGKFRAIGESVDADVSAASDTASGKIELAIQSEMETATDVVRAVTPGRQKYHPGHGKGWANITMSAGTSTLAASYNVTSITDGININTVTWDIDFSSATYAVALGPGDGASGTTFSTTTFTSKAAGSVVINGQTIQDHASNQVLTQEGSAMDIIACGDQA